ncbi:MAG: secretion protein HlyD [Acidimicrobiales bacterium]|nr:secretion protein HlyD [Acidimicrobiales bacterium]
MTTIRQKLLKPWVIMPLAALLAFGGWFAFVRPADSTPSTTAGANQRTVVATKGPLAKTVTADGTVAAAETDDLNFTSAGTVTAVDVAAGQTVKKGQVLATLDSAALQAAVTNAESTVADAEATLSDDTAAAASDTQLQADQSAINSANDALDTAKQALDGAQLVATFDGTVAAVNIATGDELSSSGTGGTGLTGSASGSGQSASTLGSSSTGAGTAPGGSSSSSSSSTTSTAQIQVISTGRFTVDLAVDSADVSNVKVGQVGAVTVSTNTATTSRFGGFGGGGFAGGGFPGGGNANAGANGSTNGSTTTTTAPAAPTQGAQGLVTEVSKVADASSGVASYPVTVAFNDTSGDYNVGATVTVAITYAEVQNAIQVPTLAVTTTNGASTVTVSSNGKDETRTVTTGLTSGSMEQITSGLKEGETVVLAFPGGLGGGGARPGGQGGGQGAGQGGAAGTGAGS